MNVVQEVIDLLRWPAGFAVAVLVLCVIGGMVRFAEVVAKHFKVSPFMASLEAILGLLLILMVLAVVALVFALICDLIALEALAADAISALLFPCLFAAPGLLHIWAYRLPIVEDAG